MKKIAIFTASVLLLHVAATAQNVGIGTLTPAAPLHIKSSASSHVLMIDGNGNSTYNSIFENGVYRGYWGSYAGNPEDMDFGTGAGNTTGKLYLTIQAVPKLTIDPAGNVGIGITSPAYRLDVGDRMRLRTSTLGNIATTPGAWLDDYRDGSLRIFTGMQDSIRWGVYGGGTGGVGWGLNFNAKSGNANIGNTTLDFYRLSLTNSDNGIGMYNAANTFYGSMASGPAGDFVIESKYASTFGGTPSADILLNPPATSLFFSPGNVGINVSTANARLHVNGNVMIGSGTPATGYQLSVSGKAMVEELKVQLHASWPDYVFSEDYHLLPLSQLEKTLQQQKHLPNIPSAADIDAAKGFEVGDLSKRLLEKVEELTLYIIDLNKKNDELNAAVAELKKQLAAGGK